MKRLWFTVIAIAVMFVVACGSSMAITPQEEAIRVAKEAASNKGIMVGEAEAIYDPLNKRWEEKVAAIESMPSDPNYGKLPHGMLYNRKYETVLLNFKEGAKEADAWVFIDKDTGDVLTIYQEQR